MKSIKESVERLELCYNKLKIAATPVALDTTPLDLNNMLAPFV